MSVNRSVDFSWEDLEGLDNGDIDEGKVDDFVLRGIVLGLIEEDGGGHGKYYENYIYVRELYKI